ncbi:MAG: GHMP kinase [Megasphaera sp.]|nr:GHMP kinase [Megasphaera sp.]
MSRHTCRLMELTVRVPGSCGELVQGYWQGRPFLITCPIGLYTTVTVSNSCHEQTELGYKSRRALQAVLDYLGQRQFPFHLRLTSQLPKGKGMASSSADMSAVMIAVAAAFGRELQEAEIASLAASIEPTDGVFCQGLVAMEHCTGRIFHRYDTVPPMAIAVFDTGGTVDTVAFHACHDGSLHHADGAAAQAFRLLNTSLTAQTLGRAATMSSLANQPVLYKPDLAHLVAMCDGLGAAGVCSAHSGTVLGVLFPPLTAARDMARAVDTIQTALPNLIYMTTTTLQSGGWSVTCI